jgi:hypothetical protein
MLNFNVACVAKIFQVSSDVGSNLLKSSEVTE